jgi:hypothetical protein
MSPVTTRTTVRLSCLYYGTVPNCWGAAQVRATRSPGGGVSKDLGLVLGQRTEASRGRGPRRSEQKDPSHLSPADRHLTVRQALL